MAVDIELLTTLADPYPIHAELCAAGPQQLDDGRWIVGHMRGDAETTLRRICALTNPAMALTDADINTAALLFQAVDATAGLIGNSVIAAARFGSPTVDDALDFVREVSRFDPAVHFTTRLATAATIDRGAIELGARCIEAGSTIVIDLAAASRDPSRWDAPDEFRPTRVGASFAFGDGAHRCPGRDEALALAAGALTAIIASTGSLDIIDIAYEPRFNLRVPTTLPWRS